jgi:hypothetical protein
MIEIIGVYPVPDAPEPCYLVEVRVLDSPGFDVREFTQEVPGEPPENWQVPDDEGLLNADGDEVVPTRWPIAPELLRGNVRLVFFMHFLDFSRPLRTPFGEIPLPEPTEQPERLAIVEYEEP